MVNKYRNKKVIKYGITFDSKKELKRYEELLLLKKVGKIKDIDLQVRFLLQEGFVLEGKKYRKIEYICDFMYYDFDKQKKIVEDVKSYITKKNPVYMIKKKMFLKRYGHDYLFIET